MTLCCARRCLPTIRHLGCDYVPNGMLPHLRRRRLTTRRCRKVQDALGNTSGWKPTLTCALNSCRVAFATDARLLTGTGCFLGLHQ